MGKLTWKVLLHPHVKEDGTQQVRLRLTKDRASRFVDTGIAIHKSQWNKKATPRLANWLTSAAHEYLLRNNALHKLGLHYEDLARENPLWDFTHLDKAAVVAAPEPVLPPEQTDFVAFFRAYVEGRALTERPGTIRLYRYLVADVAAYQPTPLPFAGVTDEWARGFYEWLMRVKGNAPGTARDKMGKLGAAARRAVKRGLLPALGNPFPELGLPVSGNLKPVSRPSLDQFERLKTVDFHSVYPAYRPAMEHRRRAWLLQHYLRGVRVSDILLLREQDVGAERLVFTEKKTSKIKSVRRTATINELLAYYPPTGEPLAFVLPFLRHTDAYTRPGRTLAQQEVLDAQIRKHIRVINGTLAVMAREAGVPRFTTHAARHLFADRLRKAGVAREVISELFNHSKLETTKAYLGQLGYDELDTAAESAFGVE